VQLADDYWWYHRSTAQLWNIDRGDVDQIEHWEDLSPGGVADRVARLVNFGQRADELGRTELDDRARALIAAVAFSARANAALLPRHRAGQRHDTADGACPMHRNVDQRVSTGEASEPSGPFSSCNAPTAAAS